MAWRASNNRAAGSAGAAASSSSGNAPHAAHHGAAPANTPPGKAQSSKTAMQAIAEIEKNREDRRRAMAAAKREREAESQMNEKMGHPGDVDFQRMIRGFREQNSDKKLPHASPGETKITICVRKRPVNAKEVKKRDYDAVTCLNPMTIVHDCKLKVDGITKYLDSNAFSFDHTFDEAASNEVVYSYTARPLVDFVFQDRGRATVFAYGQTGSGKTHTMQGIQKQIAADVFAQIDAFEKRGIPLAVYVSFFEIYGGRCQDLLHRKRLTIREDGNGEVQIVDLEEVQPQTVDDLLHVIQKGNSLRTTHATEVNDMSSRSHCICQINIRDRSSAATLHGKLSLIDLAGSERGEDTKNHNRQRRMESSEINKSLLALKECFRALDSGGRGAHIPFRASKLTQVLKDSFVNAKARTVMIATVSPCSSSSDHTVNTLRYADRVKEKHVSADAFDEGAAAAAASNSEENDDAAVDVSDVTFEQDDDAAMSPTRSLQHEAHGDRYSDAFDDDDDDAMNDGMRPQFHRADSASSQDIRLLHHSLRKQSRTSNSPAEQASDYDLETLHGVVQTLYEDQESLLNSHMNAIQESAELLTEEGQLLAEIQGDNVVDYDIDKYITRLDEILLQKASTIDALRKQLGAFRSRCEDEEMASKRVHQMPTY